MPPLVLLYLKHRVGAVKESTLIMFEHVGHLRDQESYISVAVIAHMHWRQSMDLRKRVGQQPIQMAAFGGHDLP